MEDNQSKKRRPIRLSPEDVKRREPIFLRPRGEAIDAPPYKDEKGRWRTNSLFFETFDMFQESKDGEQTWQRYTPIFTLTREHDFQIPPSSPFHGRYDPPLIPSLRRIYLSYNDPTEFKFAQEVFHSTYHWEHLCRLEWFKPYVEEWRRMLIKKLRGVGIEKMVEVAGGSDPKFALMAGKWLAEGKFGEPETKGRPKKADVQAEVKVEAAIDKIFEDDAKRLGLEITAAPSVFLDINNETKQ